MKGHKSLGEYWVVWTDAEGKGARVWQCEGQSWTAHRNHATRYHDLDEARESRKKASTPHCKAHLTHVRIRPRGERLYLTEKLAAWEPIVKQAVAFFEGVPGAIETVKKLHYIRQAVAAMPKEHRPSPG